MTLLTRLATKLQKKKIEVAKLRKQSEKKFKQVKKLSRKTISGLSSLQKKLESTHEKLDDVSFHLNQRTAQQESIMRLVAAAQERLKQEKDLKEQTMQELEFASSKEEKQQIQERLQTIVDRINELTAEIRQRNAMARKTTDAIDEFKSSKSKIANQVRKQAQSKPVLVNLMKNTKKTATRLAKQLENREKREQAVKSTLEKINKTLAKSRKSKPKRKKSKTKPKRKKVTKKTKTRRRIAHKRKGKKTKKSKAKRRKR
ncbi:MAG: ATPase V [Nitrosopumilales archaeon]|nr:ATPase V [Nitrosopumilales archaeon]